MRDCKHGALARSCPVCELESERDLWKSKFEIVWKALKSISDHQSIVGGTLTQWSTTKRMAVNAMIAIRALEDKDMA